MSSEIVRLDRKKQRKASRNSQSWRACNTSHVVVNQSTSISNKVKNSIKLKEDRTTLARALGMSQEKAALSLKFVPSE